MILNPGPEDIFPTGFNLLHLQGHGIFFEPNKAFSTFWCSFPFQSFPGALCLVPAFSLVNFIPRPNREHPRPAGLYPVCA